MPAPPVIESSPSSPNMTLLPAPPAIVSASTAKRDGLAGTAAHWCSDLGETGPYTSFNVGGGWFAGANFQIQRVVLGIEVSGNYEAAKFQTAAGSGGLASNFFRFARIDQTLALTARAGWLITLDTLLYAKGGPAQIRLTPDQLYFNAVAPNATPATNLNGYQAGIGAETFLTPNISVRAEGLYTYTANTIILNGVVPNEFKLKPYMLSGTFGAALHF